MSDVFSGGGIESNGWADDNSFFVKTKTKNSGSRTRSKGDVRGGRRKGSQRGEFSKGGEEEGDEFGTNGEKNNLRTPAPPSR